METEDYGHITFNYSGTNVGEFLNSSNNTIEPTSTREPFKWTNAEIARLIQIIFRPILVIFGTIGNIMAIYIMRRTSLKHLSSCFYMVVLAIADTILWSGCFTIWIEILTRAQVNPQTWTDCKLGFFLSYFGRHYSSVLLVLMSLKKCFAVYFPLKSKAVCTVRTAKWATGIVGVILAAYDILYFFDGESHYIKSYGYRVCIFMLDFWEIVYAVDSVLYSFGPFILMFMTNFAIVFKFMRAKCKSNSTESTNQALVKSATRGTAMVVTVSVTFLILTAPTAVYMALLDVIQIPILYFVFMNFTQYLNHSINGVLYCIVGSRFRNELLKILCRKDRTDDSSVRNMPVVTISETRA